MSRISIAILLALILLAGLSFIVNSYAGIPSPIPMLGEEAANVRFNVCGTWIHYDIPGVGDSISIDRVSHSVVGWGRYLAIFPSGDSLNLIDTSKAKLHYEIWDSSGNKVVDRDIEFDLSSGWEVTFTVRGLKPNTYTLKISISQYSEFSVGIPFTPSWSEWVERASYEYTFTIYPPSS